MEIVITAKTPVKIRRKGKNQWRKEMNNSQREYLMDRVDDHCKKMIREIEGEPQQELIHVWLHDGLYGPYFDQWRKFMPKKITEALVKAREKHLQAVKKADEDYAKAVEIFNGCVDAINKDSRESRKAAQEECRQRITKVKAFRTKLHDQVMLADKWDQAKMILDQLV
jgi:hypothetical protein